MNRIVILIILTLSIINISCKRIENKVNQESQSIPDNPYPFELSDNGGQYTIMAQIESEELFNKYYPLFSNHGYSGNGPTWEGIVIQIIENYDADLLNHIDFDSEAGAFFANADSKEHQLKFIKIVSPVFADLNKLEVFIKSADRGRVDD